ncbi:alpha/beta hydrolase [Jeotgalibaca caeni]|uniref:alpha/beta hydrolase n=1 Tax=Jeotgalibaca caeni TaxID=3028623 RepID=UPI00237D6D31|nr:alpha/beta fold hydrolase [Jeotgalibaca caeni]MDE1548846.1 alpha/beta fold hydrolase [Jeotgalibaca caeni]
MKSMKLPESFFFEKGKRAVLLLHAYTGSANDMRLLGRELEREGYTVYAPQFTGHATHRFEDILDIGSPEKWIKDVEEATQFLRNKGYNEIAVMGLSLGGVMATRALEIGDYIGGGSFNSPVFQVGESHVPAAFVNYYRSFNQRLGMDKEELQAGTERIKKKLPEQMKEIGAFSKLVQENIDKITVPYYIASAGKDELIDPENGTVLRDALSQAEVHYYHFPEATHVITVGANRKDFEESVKTFLAQLDWKEGKL